MVEIYWRTELHDGWYKTNFQIYVTKNFSPEFDVLPVPKYTYIWSTIRLSWIKFESRGGENYPEKQAN